MKWLGAILFIVLLCIIFNLLDMLEEFNNNLLFSINFLILCGLVLYVVSFHSYYCVLKEWMFFLKLFQAFVDSGAQSTIISKSCAERCGYELLFS